MKKTNNEELNFVAGVSINRKWDEIAVQMVIKFYNSGIELTEIAEEVERTVIEVLVLLEHLVNRELISGKRLLKLCAEVE